MRGKVKNIPTNKPYGFIVSDDQMTYFLHESHFQGRWTDLRIGDSVEFEIDETSERPRAINVRTCIDHDRTNISSMRRKKIEPYSGDRLHLSTEERRKALVEISKWKLEARLDDLKRYFFTIPEVDEIITGEAAYVIGRKGTGKTALVEHISEQADNKSMGVSKLTFKNFPFNELYSQDNESYTRPNQFITIWKLIIYSSVCRLMAQYSGTDPLIKRRIEKAFPNIDSDNLGSIIGHWIAGDFGVNILGNGIQVSNWLRNKQKASIQEKVENLELFIVKNTPKSFRSVVLFDELDEDYKEIFEKYQKSEYLDLLTSLFKAVQDVRAICTTKGLGIYPVIFLRDDIYDLIKDPDKNKWRDLEVDLEWKDTSIRALLSYRLSKVLTTEIQDFDTLWYSLFSGKSIVYSDGKKEIRSYDYIRMSTHGRPRDYVNYLQECATIELRNKGGEISSETIKEADKAYSNYLKKELIDEIHGIIPDIDKILSIFSEMRKWILSIEEFRSAYSERVEVGSVSIKDSDMILRTLFYFSVIGNVVRPGLHIFRHDRPNAELNFKEKIVVHRGLMKALQIV